MREMRFRARRLIGVPTHRQLGGWLSLNTSQPGTIDVAQAIRPAINLQDSSQHH